MSQRVRIKRNMTTRELLERIEESAGLSGFKIAEYLDIKTQAYYKLKSQESFSFATLAALMRLDGVDPKKVGEWIEELF